MRNPFIIGSMLKLSVFLHFAALSFHSYSTEVLSLPPPVFADTEVSTNFTFAVGEGSNRRLLFSLELEATSTNNVEIAIGCDVDEDGSLSLDEAALTVGYDCGEWFVRSAVKDSVMYSDAADSGTFRSTSAARTKTR